MRIIDFFNFFDQNFSIDAPLPTLGEKKINKLLGSSIGNLLFNNNEKYERKCDNKKCNICSGNHRSFDFQVHSKITSCKYRINKNVNCDDCGIYRVTCQCSSAYTGKTTTSFCQRFKEHFQLYRESSIRDHSKKCRLGQNIQNYKIQFLEKSSDRGKYTLSEREFLWNERLGGEINIQKILKNN